jgi:hypothetical protein
VAFVGRIPVFFRPEKDFQISFARSPSTLEEIEQGGELSTGQITFGNIGFLTC